MRREAFDRERPGDADAVIVEIGLVVEIFEFGLGGDRGVDLLLAGDARLPPCCMEACRLLVARDRAAPRAMVLRV